MGLINWVRFWLSAFWHRFSPHTIRFVYYTLIEADLEDFKEAVPGVLVKAYANEVHIRDTEDDLEFIMHDTASGKVFVQELTKFERERMVGNVKVKSKWEEVYREGVHAKRIDFVTTLNKLRGSNGGD